MSHHQELYKAKLLQAQKLIEEANELVSLTDEQRYNNQEVDMKYLERKAKLAKYVFSVPRALKHCL